MRPPGLGRKVTGLGLDHGPPAPTELDGELLGRQATDELRLCGQSPRRNRDGGGPVELSLLQTVDERGHLVTSELAPGLPLGEPHGAAGVPEVTVTGVPEEVQQLLHLIRRRRWT